MTSPSHAALPISRFARVFALEPWLKAPAYVLLFLMLVFPMVIELLYIKALLFAIALLVLGLSALRRSRLALHPAVAMWTLVLACVSLFFVFTGLVADTPGATKQAQVYVLFPCVYTLLVAGSARLRTLIALQHIVIAATIASGIYGLLFVLTEINLLPSFFFIEMLSQGQAIGLHKGYIEFNLYVLNSFPFLGPFAIAALFDVTAKDEQWALPRGWLWVAALVSICVVVLSGRRALWLVTALTPLMIATLRFVRRRSQAWFDTGTMLRALAGSFLIIVVVGFMLRTVYDFDLGRIIVTFLEGFDLRREEQYAALLDGWSENLILGGGHGSYVPASLRSETMPWAYELYYLALLYQTGVVGMTFYTAGVLWIYWMGVKIIREGGVLARMMFPTLVALSCFLIASGTNPYLPRFDGLWVIFLPVALINFWLLNRPMPTASNWHRPAGHAQRR